MEKNQGVVCGVKSCKYNAMGKSCSLQKIEVVSDMTDKHYCGSFENDISTKY